MSRKRKSKDTAVACIIRLDMDTVGHKTHIVSVHRTATGRLGQSTTYLPLPPGDLPEINSAQSEPPGPWTSNFFQPVSPVNLPPHDHTPDAPKSTVIQEWSIQHRQSYLDEMLHHDGHTGERCCIKCGGDGLYKCKDCFGLPLLCRDCLVQAHIHLPFHQVLVCTLGLCIRI